MKAYILKRTIPMRAHKPPETTFYFDGARWNTALSEAVHFARPEDARRCIRGDRFAPAEVVEVTL